MARYYTVFSSLEKALKEARRQANVEGTSHTVFAPLGAKDGWYIVGPTLDAPDIVESGAGPVYSIQAHGPHHPMVDWENEARGLCDVIQGLHQEIAGLNGERQGWEDSFRREHDKRVEAEQDRDLAYAKLQDLLLRCIL